MTVIQADSKTRFKTRVNTSDILVVWEIWKAKIYDDPKFPIRAGDVVVDLGAHIGGFSVRAAQLAAPGNVYAYEASRSNFDMLAENKKMNNIENLHAHHAAVSDIRGEMEFFLPGDNGALGSLLQDANSPRERVRAVTLADILSENGIERVDCLKMDIEGAEYAILANCSRETLQKIRYIVMEYHEFVDDSRSHRDLVRHLESHGFQVAVEGGIFPQKILFGTGIIKAWRE
ncbi:MAG: FkbM family methyltransferase [Anaerolineales bacterium]|nr:FkbM family methyltransferase [Anaerolineales bacterium]